MPRGTPHPRSLIKKAVAFSRKHSVVEASEKFGISKWTVSNWRRNQFGSGTGTKRGKKTRTPRQRMVNGVDLAGMRTLLLERATDLESQAKRLRVAADALAE